MSIPRLPSELEHAAPSAIMHGVFCLVEDTNAYARRLPRTVLDDLAQIATTITERRQQRLVADYIASVPVEHSHLSHSQRFFCLMNLFRELAVMGLAPFARAGPYPWKRALSRLTWGSLPPELAWLIEPVERYVRGPAQLDFDDALANATPELVGALQDLESHLKSKELGKRLSDWVYLFDGVDKDAKGAVFDWVGLLRAYQGEPMTSVAPIVVNYKPTGKAMVRRKREPLTTTALGLWAGWDYSPWLLSDAATDLPALCRIAVDPRQKVLRRRDAIILCQKIPVESRAEAKARIAALAPLIELVQWDFVTALWSQITHVFKVWGPAAKRDIVEGLPEPEIDDRNGAVRTAMRMVEWFD